jgi:hypothetical protein
MLKLIFLILLLFSTNSHAISTCEGMWTEHIKFDVLVGGHRQGKCQCDSCHFGGFYAGSAPTQCNLCHNGGRPEAMRKSAAHIPDAMANCNVCHSSTVSFTTGTKVPHTPPTVNPGGCLSCHNGSYTSYGAQGKPNDHPKTALSCDSSGCHNTKTFNK